MHRAHDRLIFGLLLMAVGLAGCSDTPEPAAPPLSPYTEEVTRDIKSLSAEDISAYLSGDGIGFAKAAELNSYPGPRHVLDLADQLRLTDAQRSRTQEIFDAMRAAAVQLGEQIVAHERTLDALFQEHDADTKGLHTLLQELGRLQGELRFVHLNAHLQMKTLLTETQVHEYDQLRGYGDHPDAHQHDPGRHEHTM